jgi:hypothetical protein
MNASTECSQQPQKRCKHSGLTIFITKAITFKLLPTYHVSLRHASHAIYKINFILEVAKQAQKHLLLLGLNIFGRKITIHKDCPSKMPMELTLK